MEGVSQMSQITLPKYDVEELANTMIALLDGWSDKWIGWIKLQKLLLEGRPVSPARIAADLHLAQKEVAGLIESAELDQDGNIVGFGLSIAPTPHTYRIDDRQFYVWCAADAITFPLLHKSAAVIESPDPISGEKIRLTGTPEGVRDVNPATTVVSWVPGTDSPDHIRSKFCNFTHFFSSAATASEYVAKHPGLIIVPIEQVFQIGQFMWNREPYKSIIAEL
jgi:alkylmercury lyase